MTSVRPSWSRGKMTTFRAGRSAWKLNQRQSRQQEDGGRPAVGSGVSLTPGLKQKRPQGPERVEQMEGALLLGMGRRCFCGGTERTHWVPGRGWRPRAASLLCGRKAACGNSPHAAMWGGGDTQGPAEPRTLPTGGGEKGQGRTHRPQTTLEGYKLPGQGRQPLCQERKARQPAGARSHHLNM